MPIDIVIVDSDPTHAAYIENEIITGAGQDISDRIETFSDVNAAAQHCVDVGAFLFVRSYTGVAFYVPDALMYFDKFLMCFPLGSNSFVELFNFSSLPPIVTSGAGDTQNRTGYGQGLRHFANENSGSLVAFESSYSNGRIAGILWKIVHDLGLETDLWEAFYRLQVNASKSNSWDKFDGFGIPDAQDAIDWVGVVPSFGYPIGTIGTLISSDGSSGVANLFFGSPTLNTGRYVWEKNTGSGWTEFARTVVPSSSLDLVANEETQIRSKAVNAFGESSYSNVVTVTYVPYIPPTPPEYNYMRKRYEGGIPSSKYRALLSQASTSAPTGANVRNDFTATMTLGYTSPGVYTLTASGASFPSGKTRVRIAQNVISAYFTAERTSDTVITIKSSLQADNVATNGLLSSTDLEIEVNE